MYLDSEHKFRGTKCTSAAFSRTVVYNFEHWYVCYRKYSVLSLTFLSSFFLGGLGFVTVAVSWYHIMSVHKLQPVTDNSSS